MDCGTTRLGILSFVVLALAATGCQEPKVAAPTKLSAEIPGVKITATVDGPAFVKADNKMATIFAGFSNKISVDRERVGYNGVQLVELPPHTKEVDLTISPGQIKVMADGQLVIDAAVK